MKTLSVCDMERVSGAGDEKQKPSGINNNDETKGNPRYNDAGVESCNSGIIGGMITGLLGGLAGVALGVAGGAAGGGCLNKGNNSNSAPSSSDRHNNSSISG